MKFPDHLMARAGDLIDDKWRALQKWVETLEIRRGNGEIKLTVTPGGTFIKVDQRMLIKHPFQVSATGSRARVRIGTIDGELPWIKSGGKDAVRLGGYDAEYLKVPEPELTISPRENGITWVALRWKEAEEASEQGTDPEALQIVHIFPQEVAEDTEPSRYQPLAILIWRDGALKRTIQNVHHNLVHSYRKGTGEKPGVHYFSAV